MTTDDLRPAQALLAAVRGHTRAALAQAAGQVLRAQAAALPPALVQAASALVAREGQAGAQAGAQAAAQAGAAFGAVPRPAAAQDIAVDGDGDASGVAVGAAAPDVDARDADAVTVLPAFHPLAALQAMAAEAGPHWRARGLDPAAAQQAVALALRLAALPESHEAWAALCRALHPAAQPWATPALVLQVLEAGSAPAPLASPGAGPVDAAAPVAPLPVAAPAPASASAAPRPGPADHRAALQALLQDPPPGLRGWFTLHGSPGGTEPWHSRSLRLDPGLVAALHALAPPAAQGRLLGGAAAVPPGLQAWLAEPATALAVQALAQGRPCRIALVGGDAALRASRVQALLGAARAVALGLQAAGDGLPGYSAEAGAHIDAHLGSARGAADRLAAAHTGARLHRAALWLEGGDDDSPGPAAVSGSLSSAGGATAVAAALADIPWALPVLQTARLDTALAPLPLPLLRVAVAPLAAAERRALWLGLLPQLGAAAGPLAARYAVEPHDALEVVRDLRLRQSLHGAPVGADDVAALVRERGGWQARPGVRRVQPRAGFAQLQVPPPLQAQLQAAVQRVAQQLTVLDDWGYAPGPGGRRGVRLLFCGAPGTGKSLAAEAMAGALGVHLLVVDLASLVSKWIGETEKNLAAVFDAAERARALLLFDEADALFGRRSEGQDANDRHANLETAYLLQRLEAYEGIAVLTTNLRSHLDSAFSRRFEFILEFPEPDAAARLALWRQHLPATAPRAADVDLPQLADWYALTGAQIRNAALAAAFAAAAEGTVPAQRHLLAAIEREHDKAGRAHPGYPPGAALR